MKITNCLMNHLENPLGFAMDAPVFSYQVEDAAGKHQAAARIRISADAQGQQVLADTGFAPLNSLGERIALPLRPCTRYWWTAAVRTDAGEEAASEPHWFETGKREQAWQGQWISCAPEEKRHPIFHKTFAADGEIRQARLYICGLGLYEASINGQAVTQAKLTPGLQDYASWVQVQTYDVTKLLQAENEISVLMGRGWYLGRFTVDQGKVDVPYHGTRWKLIAELQLRYADGREEVIGTDDSWQVTRSNIVFSDIYDGEQVDDTLPDLPEENAVLLHEALPLEDQRSIPVLPQEEIRPIALLDTPAGEKVFDLGQNFAGGFRLTVHEPRGTRICVQTGEVLQKGNFYRDNLRGAKSEYVYISDGKPHVLSPKFTYYGYRYAKVTAVHHLTLDSFVGVAYYSDVRPVSTMVTGDEKLNQLLSNIRWGQKSNFVDVPTDCPQRDERMGWTGDTQVFAATACYLTDACAFYEKYLYDMQKEQNKRGGCVPDTIPAFYMRGGCCVWGDAATILPWTLYLFYGDVNILRTALPSMRAWVDYIAAVDGDTHHWREVFHFGDWLALDHPSGRADEVRGGTDEGFIADAYYYHSTRLVAKAAAVLGDNETAAAYQKRAEKILSDLQQEYFTPTGRCAVDTQTAQILALYFGLNDYPERAHRELMRLLHLRGDKLSTGFVGTPLLCRVLSQVGEDKMAYHLLHNEEYPGWLYEVNLGATTIWERWNSLSPDGSVSSTGMNSFNHYAYGAIGEWMWRTMAGINPCEEQPGFKRVVLRPVPDTATKHVTAEYHSPAGCYRVAWCMEEAGICRFHIEIPFDCTASLLLLGEKPMELECGCYDFACAVE